MADDNSDFEMMILPIMRFINDILNRVPFADWYNVEDRRNMRFSNHTVVSGLYMKISKPKRMQD